MKINDFYTIALLMWFFGMDATQVRNETWTDAEIAKAQAYAKETHFDAIDWYNDLV